MANSKLKIGIYFIFLAFILSFFFCFCFANENVVTTEIKEYDRIYSELEEADFEYIFGIDPKQTDEYTVYMYSPYPLFRSGVNLIFKTKTIPPGYYLLTPREKDGKTYILFKENGKVVYMVPIYKEDTVPEMFYEELFPHPKPNAYERARNKTMDFIGTKWGKKNQRTPVPKSYIEFEDKGVYWDMVLYYGSKKYYLLFKKDN